MKRKIFNRKRQLRKLGTPYVSEREAWDLFSHQAKYILAGLRTFYKMKRWGTSPNDMLEKAYAKRGLSITDDYEKHKAEMDAGSNEARAEWDDALREMIYVFDQIVNDFPDDPFTKWSHEEDRKLEAAGIPPFTLVKKSPVGNEYKSNLPPMPNEVREAEKSFSERIKKGLHLYAKYFLDLWD